MSQRLQEHLGRVGLVTAFLLFVPLAQAHDAPQAFSPPPQASGYSLAFDDEFNSPDIIPNGADVYTWYPGLWFFHKPAPAANFVEAPGQLDLIWDASQAAPETTIVMLSADKTQYKTFRYGYFEARMKWDAVTGAWPAFWLLPLQDALGQDYYNGVKELGELDVFEGQGAQPNTFIGTVHDWINGKNSGNRNGNYKLPASNNFSEFHTYGVLWQAGQLTWNYDNQSLMSAPTPAIMNRPDFVPVLAMQEGATWQYGNRTGVTAAKMDLSVSWVRIWQH